MSGKMSLFLSCLRFTFFIIKLVSDTHKKGRFSVDSTPAPYHSISGSVTQAAPRSISSRLATGAALPGEILHVIPSHTITADTGRADHLSK